MNRRSFFQTMLTAVGAVTLYSVTGRAERRRGGGAAASGALTFVDPKDAAAKGVHYVSNNKDMKDKSLQTERNGVKFTSQHCKACAFYQADKETTIGGRKGAPCQMPFAAGKAVSSEGWCTSWAKKS